MNQDHDRLRVHLSILAAVAARIHGEEEQDRILDIALEEILRGLGLRAAWVFLGEQKDRKLHLAASRGVAASYLEAIEREGLSDCLCPEVFSTGHAMQARNTTECPRMPSIVAGLARPVAHACIPLRLDGESRGVLNVAASADEHFSEDDLRFLETVGHQVCVGVERATHRRTERLRHRDLQAAQQRILQSEKMAVLGAFASGLAHEVRNPLNSIALQLTIVERRVGRMAAEVSAPLEELIGVIREEIKRLDALVGDFLQFSRPNRPRYQPASLDALADEVVRLLQPEARAAGVTLRRQALGEAIPSLPMDAERMKQVVINLVKNAVEAVPDGGVVTVETGIVDDQARIAVRDTGQGLPEGLDIFQLFVTNKPKGTGLGLAIAQQIVLEHGGEIAARNLESRGAEFVVALPLPPPLSRLKRGSHEDEGPSRRDRGRGECRRRARDPAPGGRLRGRPRQ